jgi:hypothetical protein
MGIFKQKKRPAFQATSFFKVNEVFLVQAFYRKVSFAVVVGKG